VEVLAKHLSLLNPRFRCEDRSRLRSLTVPLTSLPGAPASVANLRRLREIAGSEYPALEPLYSAFNGVALHKHGRTAGLVVASVDELLEFNTEWRESMGSLTDDELYDFQRDGVAFATIAASGNYFAVYRGKVFYSDHDGGDDTEWSDGLDAFFERALKEPAKFLHDAGSYTRYSDGKTETQFIPREFLHD
jgi:hypothetical protein